MQEKKQREKKAKAEEDDRIKALFLHGYDWNLEDETTEYIGLRWDGTREDRKVNFLGAYWMLLVLCESKESKEAKIIKSLRVTK